MKVLVIPDCHLKKRIFWQASEIMEKGVADLAVSLMDIADDFGMQYELSAYEAAFEAAITFAKYYPKTRWCWGNHELSYLWSRLESGYSSYAAATVVNKIQELKLVVPDGNLGYLQRIGRVIFSHGGLSRAFVDRYVPDEKKKNIDEIIATLNKLGESEIWVDDSPIWLRPQYSYPKLYGEGLFLQVVGHTPVHKIVKEGNLISCDVFSTYRNKTPIGSREFMVIDTNTWEYECLLPGD